MAYAQADLDAIRKAIATGANKVRFADGREVTYRTLADMRSIEADIAAALAPPDMARPRVTFASFTRD